MCAKKYTRAGCGSQETGIWNEQVLVFTGFQHGLVDSFPAFFADIKYNLIDESVRLVLGHPRQLVEIVIAVFIRILFGILDIFVDAFPVDTLLFQVLKAVADLCGADLLPVFF